MTKTYSHLPLPRSSALEKKRSRGFGYEKVDRDMEKFYQSEIKNLESVGSAYKKDKRKYQEYFDPNLIFKIKLTKKSSYDESFRADLKRAGIETISSAADKAWITFTDDAEFTKFRQKLEKRRLGDKATFIDLIDGIREIPTEEKLGKSLHEKPIAVGKPEHIDVEVWRMEDSRLSKFISGLKRLIKEKHGNVLDELVTNSFCILRIECDGKLFSEIIKMREISNADRPLKMQLEDKLVSDIEDFKIKGPPDINKPGILIVDSGINNHPLLENAIANRIVIPPPNKSNMPDIDDAGHGTSVAGIALYGDIQKCIENNEFDPQIWLYSAKIMHKDEYGDAAFDTNSLLEHQLKNAIEQTITEHPRCKIINISLGDTSNTMTSGQRQFRIASLIDELSTKYFKIMFTIAAGNIDDYDTKSYPNYLVGHDDGPPQESKIIDPATSVHGITVGSIVGSQTRSNNLDLPSPFTRVGPGLQDMIKPELVDYGGGFEQDIITIDSEWVEGRLFINDTGTSLSSPKIAHYLAKLQDNFPNASRNYLKALLLSSANPPEPPAPLNKIDLKNNNGIKKILNIYGYGKPDLDRALYSEPNRVLLFHDGEIELNTVQFFPINLPEEFLSGKRSIEVTLTFDPPTNRNRANYLGVTMEYHLFRNSSLEDIEKSYGQVEIHEGAEDIVPKKIKGNKIKMLPGVNIRKKGAHQKSSGEYSNRYSIRGDKPLVLAVICQKRWLDEKNYVQRYSVIVTFKHAQEIDLYNTIRLKNKVRVRT